MSESLIMTQENKAYNNDETWPHIEMVMKNISIIQSKLTERMFTHDRCKLSMPEVQHFTNAPKLSGIVYGSEEYTKSIQQLKPALDHHYAKSKHHPEHYKNGINDMTLVDLMEMFCDWYASTKRQDNGNIRKSIEKNREKYGMSDQLVRIFENTINEFGEL